MGYKPNGATNGTVPTDNNHYASGATATVKGNSGNLVKTGYTFTGWNNAPTGNGTINVAPGDALLMGSADVTLFAQWKPLNPPYSVTYDGNGNTGGTVPTDTNNYPQGATVTVKGNTGNLVKNGGYILMGWNPASNGSGLMSYASGNTFPMGSGNVTLYAQWRYIGPLYIVTYYGNGNTGGTVPTDIQPYAPGAPVAVKGNTGNLVKTGYTFAGWNTAPNGGGLGTYNPGDTFPMSPSNVPLYAQWKQ